VALSELLFVADNLAYFSYQQLDEPLFVMNQIDMIVTTSGSLVLDMFSEVTITALLELLHRVPTGQGKLEKVREFEWSGKGQGKLFFWKSLGK